MTTLEPNTLRGFLVDPMSKSEGLESGVKAAYPDDDKGSYQFWWGHLIGSAL